MKLFRRKHLKTLTVGEMMEKADNEVRVEKHGKTTYVYLYAVVDKGNSYKTVKDGFKTRAETKAFCGYNYNLFINPYWKAI